MPFQFLARPDLWGHQVYGLFTHNAYDGSSRGVDDYPSCGRKVNVHSTDSSKRYETVIRDVLDHETDLVGVTGEHDPRASARVQDSDGVAVNVHIHLIRKGRGSFHPNFLGGALESGWARRRNEISQEVDRFFTH